MKSDLFNIELEVEKWRKSLLKYQAIEPEFADELVSGLLDRYEEFIEKGLHPSEAFIQAKRKTISNPSELAKEISMVKRGSNSLFGSLMFLLPNYFKIGWRNLSKKRFYNVINIISLTIGIVCSILATMYINYETSFDNFVPDANRIYRMGQTLRSQDYSMIAFEEYNSASAEQQKIHINAIKNTKGVEDACQFFIFDEPLLVKNLDGQLSISKTLQTNTPKSFLDMFNWQLIAGSKKTFIENPNTILLTESEVSRFFGSNWVPEKVIGNLITIDTFSYTIAGVVEDVPPNSHLHFNGIINQNQIQYWGARTYLKIPNDTKSSVVNNQLNKNIDKINPRLAKSELFGGFTLDRLENIHLNSNKLYEIKPPGEKQYLYIFGIISGIILLLTVSNYTNLSIALNASRMHEIGMRKIFGADASGISRQFLFEAIFISLICIPFVIISLLFLIPRFNNFLEISLNEHFYTSHSFWMMLIIIVILVSLLSGLYPSIFLSRKKIADLFKGDLAKNRLKGFTTRKTIISFQFVLLIGLFSLTLLVNNQLDYINNKDLGYQKENILYVSINDDWNAFSAFKNEVKKLSGVLAVGTGSTMGTMPYNQTTYKLQGTDQIFDDAYNFYLDYASLGLLGIKTSIQEYIENPQLAPKGMVLINNTAADKFSSTFNIPIQDLIGRTIIEEPEYTSEETGDVGFPFQIGGFFDDINVFSLKEKVTPMFIRVYRESSHVYWASIQYDKESSGPLLQKVENIFNKIKPNSAFVHSFITQNISDLYGKEQKIGKLCVYFSVIAFIVAIIGLIALTAYLTALKRKEIGIRKILGASSFEIIKQFNREYISHLLIASGIAIPLTYYGVSKWLTTFEYSADISFIVFLFAILVTFTISCMAVSLVTLNVIRGEPVNALRDQL